MDLDKKPAEQKAPAKKQATGLKYDIEKMRGQLEKALPSSIGIDRFQRICLTALSKSPKLQQSEKGSFFGAVLFSAQLGLEPNTPLGHCYLIPYENRKKGIIEAQFQIGYQGVLDLAYRSGGYKRIKAVSVDSADEFSYAYGLDDHLKHVPSDNPTGEIVKYYALYETNNGGKDFCVWSKEKIISHAKEFSQSWDKQKGEFRYGSAWREHFDGMAKKTALLDLMKYAPKSIEMRSAQSFENGVIKMDTNNPDLTVEAEFSEVN